MTAHRVHEPRPVSKREGNLAAAQYRAIFEAAPDAILVVDGEGRIRDLNPKAESLFGYARDELLGAEVEALVPARAREAHRAERELFAAHPRSRPMGIGLDLKGWRKDGSEVPVEISLSPLQTEEGLYVIAIVRDMTERNRLRAFGAGAMRTAEEERLRIARELHDDTAQRLAALLVRLRVARDVEDADRRRELLDELRDELLGAAEAVRRIARGLRPPELEEMGLFTAIRRLARTTREAHGLEVVVEAAGEEARLPLEAELALYRILQEALSNVVRHAGATRAEVSLSLERDRLVAVVADDGRGFDPAAARGEGGRGLGLTGMRERAVHLGGAVRVESVPGRGTSVHVEVPLAAPELGDVD